MEIRAIKANKELADLRKKITIAKEIAEAKFDLHEYRPCGPKEVELGEEISLLPTRDIAAELIKVARQVAEVRLRSGNLAGVFQKILKEVALYVKV